MKYLKIYEEFKLFENNSNFFEVKDGCNVVYHGGKFMENNQKWLIEQDKKLKNFIKTTIREFLNEQNNVNESEFGFGEFPKPKKEIYLQLMDRARKDGLLSDIHYGDKRIRNIAIEIATEFEKMEEPNKQSNKDLFLGMFYDRIPKWAWGNPTNSILMKYGLRKS